MYSKFLGMHMNVSGKNVEFEEKHIMEKNGFEVLGGGGVSGDGDWVGRVCIGGISEKFPEHFREISGKFPENHRVVR